MKMWLNFEVVENELQSILDEVSVLIGRSVSENIKVPTGNPFFDTVVLHAVGAVVQVADVAAHNRAG